MSYNVTVLDSVHSLNDNSVCHNLSFIPVIINWRVKFCCEPMWFLELSCWTVHWRPWGQEETQDFCSKHNMCVWQRRGAEVPPEVPPVVQSVSHINRICIIYSVAAPFITEHLECVAMLLMDVRTTTTQRREQFTFNISRFLPSHHLSLTLVSFTFTAK